MTRGVSWRRPLAAACISGAGIWSGQYLWALGRRSQGADRREEQADQSPPIPIVLLSAMTRMVASLAMRLTENVNTEYFKSEAEAKPWLDERMDVFIAQGGSTTL